jgi:hypothetical protein
MTQAQTLNVEKDELLARADELEAPITGQPSENPQPPCTLAMVTNAAQQLGLSADNMRLYLGVGERERRRLAVSLRNAAKAYEELDEDAAQALSTGTSVSAVTPRLVDGDLDALTLSATPVVAFAAEPTPYDPIRQAAQQIAQPDQGASFDRFAQAWEAHQRTLLEARYRFRPFQSWEGEATYAVEQNFDQQRSWLDQMAALCGTMAAQARGVAAAQRRAFSQHPTVAQIKELDDAWHWYQQPPQKEMYWESAKPQILRYYAEYQTKSEEVLTEYVNGAALPLPPVSPPKPPVAHRIDSPQEPELGRPNLPGSPGNPADGLPLDAELPDPTGMPGVPSAGAPSTPDAALTDALTDALTETPGLPRTGGPALKPASLGGGAGGVPSMPSMPLQPAVDPESVSRPAAAARDLAGLGRTNLAAGGAMGGGGMGMAPMGGPGAQGQGAGKGKRAQQDDKALYTEDRPWTEAVIGRRRA